MSLIKNAGFMSVAVIISRVLGLIREQIFAFLFGAGMYTDAFLIAFRIPNLFRDLLAEGALSSAFVSVFAGQKRSEEQKALARDLFRVLGLVLVLVALIIFFFAPQIVGLLAPGFRELDGKFELTVLLTKVFAPFLLFVSFAALSMGILNTLGSFFLPSLGAAAFNLSSIVIGGSLGALFSFQFISSENPIRSAIIAFACASVLGAFMQWVIQWKQLFQRGYQPWKALWAWLDYSRFLESFQNPNLRQVFYLMGPFVVSVAALQVNVVVNSIFAASVGNAAVSWLNYAYRIIHLPMGVFGVALSTAALPALARSFAAGKTHEFSAALERSINFSVILAVGSTAGLVAFAEPIVRLLFEHGRFEIQDTRMTSQAVIAYGLGLVAFNVQKIFVQAFFAIRKVWIPSSIALFTIAINYFGNAYAAPLYGHVGLAATTASVAFFNLIALGVVLSFLNLLPFKRKLFKVLGVSLLSCLPLVFFRFLGGTSWLFELANSSSRLIFAFATFGGIVLLGGCYLSLVALLTEEGRGLLRRLQSRFSGKK